MSWRIGEGLALLLSHLRREPVQPLHSSDLAANAIAASVGVGIGTHGAALTLPASVVAPPVALSASVVTAPPVALPASVVAPLVALSASVVAPVLPRPPRDVCAKLIKLAEQAPYSRWVTVWVTRGGVKRPSFTLDFARSELKKLGIGMDQSCLTLTQTTHEPPLVHHVFKLLGPDGTWELPYEAAPQLYKKLEKRAAFGSGLSNDEHSRLLQLAKSAEPKRWQMSSAAAPVTAAYRLVTKPEDFGSAQVREGTLLLERFMHPQGYAGYRMRFEEFGEDHALSFPEAATLMSFFLYKRKTHPFRED